jgi:hypothetical protein
MIERRLSTELASNLMVPPLSNERDEYWAG